MKSNEVLKEIMRKHRIRQTVLIEKTGLKQTTVSERLKRDNVSIDNYVQLLNALGYGLYVMDESGEECYKIE